MNHDLNFVINRTSFDENYQPAEKTRATTNFANLARGCHRQENLKNTLTMISNRFNALAHWDNPNSDRYNIELEIISVELNLHTENSNQLPLIEILKTTIIDKKTGDHIDGMVGNNFSSYVRDYDFSIVLPEHNKNSSDFSIPENFGELHGKIYKSFVNSDIYRKLFHKQPVICLSVSSSKSYHQTGNIHPILGIEYTQDEYSLTDFYFKKMGLKVRYFMPAKSVAPFAFYFSGDLLNDYSNLELISIISTMDSFQKIYRPEIYNANSVAGQHYRPSLNHDDYSLSRIIYDREERSQLAVQQGKFIQDNFITPYKSILNNWSINNLISIPETI